MNDCPTIVRHLLANYKIDIGVRENMAVFSKTLKMFLLVLDSSKLPELTVVKIWLRVFVEKDCYEIVSYLKSYIIDQIITSDNFSQKNINVSVKENSNIDNYKNSLKYFDSFVYTAILFREVLSINENLLKLGYPLLPKKLIKYMKDFNEELDKEEDKEDEKEKEDDKNGNA